ncbi:MAG TPA: PAS domain-containing protein [Caulobacteraceae bacterium]|nr:PAS domain-containing protein [Caulobacteraceae bacterium]
MFHPGTELLIDYWRGLPRRGPAPARADVDPGCFAALAPRAFTAALEAGEPTFRLAGEQLIELHGRALAGEPVSQTWRLIHRRRLAGLVCAALASGEPLVLAAEAWTGAHRVRLEVLFAPLTSRAGAVDRCLGLYQLTAGVWAGPIGELAITGAFGVADPPTPTSSHLRLAAVDGLRIA